MKASYAIASGGDTKWIESNRTRPNNSKFPSESEILCISLLSANNSREINNFFRKIFHLVDQPSHQRNEYDNPRNETMSLAFNPKVKLFKSSLDGEKNESIFHYSCELWVIGIKQLLTRAKYENKTFIELCSSCDVIQPDYKSEQSSRLSGEFAWSFAGCSPFWMCPSLRLMLSGNCNSIHFDCFRKKVGHMYTYKPA